MSKENALSQVFAYGDRMVRSAGTVEAPLFVAKDVCACLGIADTEVALRRLRDNQKGTCTVRTPGGPQQMLCVTEAGVYRLIFTSRKDEAERFQDWVCGEVLPSIRRTGSYSAPGAAPTLNPEQLAAIISTAVVAAVSTQLAAERDIRVASFSFIGRPRSREVSQTLTAYAKAISKTSGKSERSERRRAENRLRGVFAFDGPGSSWEFFPAVKWPELRQELERLRSDTERLNGPTQDPLPFSSIQS